MDKNHESKSDTKASEDSENSENTESKESRENWEGERSSIYSTSSTADTGTVSRGPEDLVPSRELPNFGFPTLIIETADQARKMDLVGSDVAGSEDKSADMQRAIERAFDDASRNRVGSSVRNLVEALHKDPQSALASWDQNLLRAGDDKDHFHRMLKVRDLAIMNYEDQIVKGKRETFDLGMQMAADVTAAAHLHLDSESERSHWQEKIDQWVRAGGTDAHSLQLGIDTGLSKSGSSRRIELSADGKGGFQVNLSEKNEGPPEISEDSKKQFQEFLDAMDRKDDESAVEILNKLKMSDYLASTALLEQEFHDNSENPGRLARLQEIQQKASMVGYLKLMDEARRASDEGSALGKKLLEDSKFPYKTSLGDLKTTIVDELKKRGIDGSNVSLFADGINRELAKLGIPVYLKLAFSDSTRTLDKVDLTYNVERTEALSTVDAREKASDAFKALQNNDLEMAKKLLAESFEAGSFIGKKTWEEIMGSLRDGVDSDNVLHKKMRELGEQVEAERLMRNGEELAHHYLQSDQSNSQLTYGGMVAGLISWQFATTEKEFERVLKGLNDELKRSGSDRQVSVIRGTNSEGEGTLSISVRDNANKVVGSYEFTNRIIRLELPV